MNTVNTWMRMFHDSPASRVEQRTQDGDYPSHTFFWRQLRVKYYDNTDARHRHGHHGHRATVPYPGHGCYENSRGVIFDGTFPTEEWNDNLKDRGKAGMRNPKVRIRSEFFNGFVLTNVGQAPNSIQKFSCFFSWYFDG